MMGLRYGRKVDIPAYVKEAGPHHFMRKYQGFGCSVSELEEMKAQGVVLVGIHYTNRDEEHTLFLSLLEWWFNSGKADVNPLVKDDEQLFLPVEMMSKLRLSRPGGDARASEFL